MDGDLFGGLYAQSHFVAADFDDDNRDVVVDDDAFVLLPRQHQHNDSPFGGDNSTCGAARMTNAESKSVGGRGVPAKPVLPAFPSLWTELRASQELTGQIQYRFPLKVSRFAGKPSIS